MKVLVVDDEENLCRLYAEELQDEGYLVLTANGAIDALRLFEDENPDLVTLDICMSRVDEGLTVLRQMKALRPSTPIIMLSAFDFRDDFQSWAADCYISKSTDLSELKCTIKGLLVGI